MAQLFYWKFEWGVKHWVSSSRRTLWPKYIPNSRRVLGHSATLSPPSSSRKMFASAKGQHISRSTQVSVHFLWPDVTLVPNTCRSDNVKCLLRPGIWIFYMQRQQQQRIKKNTSKRKERKREQTLSYSWDARQAKSVFRKWQRWTSNANTKNKCSLRIVLECGLAAFLFGCPATFHSSFAILFFSMFLL